MICCAAIRYALLALAGAAALVCLGCAGGGSGSVSALADLTNPFLGPDYTAWLIGPVARIAKPDEIKAYLALHDDAAAATFIQQFWEKRDAVAAASAGAPGFGLRRTALAVFEERAAVADKKYSEGGRLGRRTDRGTILILYGQPSRGGFEVSSRPGGAPIEVWEYPANAPPGLDGKTPDRFYRFTKVGDLTVLYVPRPGELLHAPAAAPPP